MEIDKENFEKINLEIKNLIKKELSENSALLGINIGTQGGSSIASHFKEKYTPKLRENEISAATSSLLFLSSKLIRDSLNQKISHNIITGKKTIILSFLTENITLVAYLERELAELEGFDVYVKRLEKFALQISAYIETSELIKEEIFKALKRAIPDLTFIAIMTRDGLPIKIQSTMPEPMISAMVSALFNLSDILLQTKDLEYSIISGEQGSIIIHSIDDKRLLCIAVPAKEKLGSYIVKIKNIIKT
ncbi:MAG: roadblock/LC7 domain-containing protein [Promethearchaeota archaeon]